MPSPLYLLTGVLLVTCIGQFLYILAFTRMPVTSARQTPGRVEETVKQVTVDTSSEPSTERQLLRAAPSAAAAAANSEAPNELVSNLPSAGVQQQPKWYEGFHVPEFAPHSRTGGRSLLSAWRAGSVDWHDLVPSSNLVGSDAQIANAYRWKQLVESELAVISWLQGFDKTLEPNSTPVPISPESGGGDSKPDWLAARDVSQWMAPERLWGPLAKYAACPRVRDKCVIHASVRECALDELCGWCEASAVCVFRGNAFKPEMVTGAKVPVCVAPLLILSSSVPSADDTDTIAVRFDIASSALIQTERYKGGPQINANCDIFVSASRHARVSIEGNAKMAYHFYQENAGELTAKLLHGALRTHIYVSSDSAEEFLPTLHAFSDSCWRYERDVISMLDTDGHSKLPTICYALTPNSSASEHVAVSQWDVTTRTLHAQLPPKSQVAVESLSTALAAGMRLGPDQVVDFISERGLTAVNGAGKSLSPEEYARAHSDLSRYRYSSFIVASLGLQHVFPPAGKPLVTLISRRNKRLILNEPELVAECHKLGVDVVVASLETMPLYEQVLLFRRTSVLVGMHGSGLINSIYMHPGSALLQLMPYKVSSGASFFEAPASDGGVNYHEWTNKHVEKSVFHWHFLGADYAARKDTILSQGSDCCGQSIYFSFWINQDTWVEPEEFSQVLQAALRSVRLR